METPYYQFDKSVVEQNFNRMKELLSPCRIFYSMKSNPNIRLANILNTLGAGFEVCSLQEISDLNRLKVDKQRIYCGLPVMEKKLISRIYEIGCEHFVFDSIKEFKLLLEYAPNAKKIMRISVADLSSNAIGYGIGNEEMEFLLSKYTYEIDGISFHISNHDDLQPAINALERVEQLLDRFNKKMIINIGGSYDLQGSEEAYSRLKNKMNLLSTKHSLEWMCELGSSIINTAGSVITRVVATHEQNGFTDVFIDAGIPAGVMRKPKNVINLEKNRESDRTYYRFFDTTSMKKLLFQSILKQRIIDNDCLQLTDYGAYSLCYSNNFHSQPKPKVKIIGSK